MLEYINDGQGTVITLDGVNKKWTKGKNGDWIEEDVKRGENAGKVTTDEKIILPKTVLANLIEPRLSSTEVNYDKANDIVCV